VFLAGLVILGPPQRWWVQALLESMDSLSLFFGAVGLTAVTDNAALTYLGTLVENLSDQNKFALLAGAVAGGGLTVIANAPNPAGFSILKYGFKDQSVSPLGLLLAALLPTAVAAAAFLIFPA
jgi:predicted cation transporter